ncbi:DUF2306 domain-containing protein [Paenibacillus sinopodophylli]|uniref:DUF2306 domain-containing protein n=1 Tax=Paenibacillus sinopodophylli TaxID=1837342 RepID=UPI001FE465F6|nr:DUF2306 domain-containing protein [Paenibacillus sinopodophylli]
MMKKWNVVFIFFLAFAVAGYAIVQYSLFDASDAGLVAAKLQEPEFQLTPWVYVLYAHIVTAVLALAIGPFQLFHKKSKPRGALHKRLGYVYVLSIVISSVAGIYLSLFATGGLISGLGFFILDILWVTTTLIALRKIMVKDIKRHREWMLRSYALTFAGVTLRIWLAPLVMLFGDFVTGYLFVAWLCWVPNLIVMEAIIRRRSNKQSLPIPDSQSQPNL